MGGKTQNEAPRRFSARAKPPPDWAAWTREALAGLLAEGIPVAEAEVEARRMCERMKIRLAWFRQRFDEFVEMQERAGEAVDRYMDERPEIDWDAEDAPEVPEPPEQAIAQAIHAEVMAAAKEDRWPRHLHFHDV
ncbi:MAG TPA: hypothetical protein VF718_10450 [Allosphingosinicella sp.]|jgi:hypothetical protein